MRLTQRGVTLVELVVVVLIIGIIAAIAVPSYRSYMIRTNRTDAKVALASYAAGLERCFTRHRAYNSDSCASFTALPETVPSGTYLVSFTEEPTATSYTLQAAPQGRQTNDSQCGTFTLNQANEKGLAGIHSQSTASCWNR